MTSGTLSRWPPRPALPSSTLSFLGRAPLVSIDVYEDGGAVVAMVEDNGKGFDVASTLQGYASRSSLGLLQMRESARLIGAQLSLDSSPGQGTRVRLVIPFA